MLEVRRWYVASAVVSILLLPALAGPASAASYAWGLSCKFDGSVGASSSWANWDWLQDGQVLVGAGGTAGCGGSGGWTGAGDRPAEANGVTVSITAQAIIPLVGLKTVTKSVSKSFDPTESFKPSLHAHASTTGRFCFFGSCGPIEHASVGASFTMTG